MGDLSEWQVIVSEMVRGEGGKSRCHIPSRRRGVGGSAGGRWDVTGEREADLPPPSPPPPPGSGNAPLTSAPAQTHPSHRDGGTRRSCFTCSPLNIGEHHSTPALPSPPATYISRLSLACDSNRESFCTVGQSKQLVHSSAS